MTLQALRRLLFFSVDEAAAMIGGASSRSWQIWEQGEQAIPDDVIERVRSLCAWRAQTLATAGKLIAELQARQGPDASVALLWYHSLDDWETLPGREPVQWRPQCSVVAELAAQHGARLVAFDGPAYAKWLGQREDSDAMRASWASL